jgi:phage gp29-like protein
MKIGNINISRDGIFNIEKRKIAVKNKSEELFKKKNKKIVDRISKQTFTRIRANIARWQSARASAESELMPNNTELIRIFKDIEIDAHLFALMQTIRLKVIANKFAVYNENDEIDEDATALFQKKWFRNVSREIVDSKFYGFSLIQLGDIIGGSFTGAEIVPREYVVQQKRGVKTSLGNTTDLVSFDDRKFVNWLIPVGSERDLGILDKAAPLVIKKKEVISAWSEAAELFGMPIRIGKTDINDPESRDNMEDMLENMGEAAFGVFDKEDEIELINTSKTDFSNMYDKFIERINSELSKLILLQTGTTDEKAFVGSAEVHEGILSDLIEAYVLDVEDVANEIVIPICERHGLIKMGCYLKADNEQKFSPTELFNIVKELLNHYDIAPDWINETFEVPVDEKETPDALKGDKTGVKPKDKPKDEDAESEARKDAVNKMIDPKASYTDIMKAVSAIYEQQKPR